MLIPSDEERRSRALSDTEVGSTVLSNRRIGAMEHACINTVRKDLMHAQPVEMLDLCCSTSRNGEAICAHAREPLVCCPLSGAHQSPPPRRVQMVNSHMRDPAAVIYVDT